MADTQRTMAAILALLGDNTTGDISAQDLRDVVTTLRPDHGEIYITASAATTVVTQNTWYPVSGTFSLTASPAPHNFAMSTNGQLKYTGAETRAFHVAASFSLTSANNNKVYELGVGVNGTISVPSIVRRLIATGADVGTGALHAFLELSTNDYMELMIRNTTDADDPTLVLANLFAMGMPM